ncbi:hypothetical protein [Pradoshia sp.]
MLETIRSAFTPYQYKREIRQPMTIRGYSFSFTALILYSLLLSGFSGFLGVGSEPFSAIMEQTEEGRWDTAKSIFLLGQATAGILAPLFFTLFFALLIWLVFEELDFGTVWRMQLVPLIIMIFGKTVDLIVMIMLRVPEHSSPLGFGVIAQSMTGQTFWVMLAAEVTIFALWAASSQYRLLHKGLGFNRRKVLLVIILFWIIYILFNSAASTLIHMMKVSL